LKIKERSDYFKRISLLSLETYIYPNQFKIKLKKS